MLCKFSSKAFSVLKYYAVTWESDKPIAKGIKYKIELSNVCGIFFHIISPLHFFSFCEEDACNRNHK